VFLAWPRTTAAQYPAPKVSLLDGGGAKDGYWAIEPDPATDPSGQKRHGRLYAPPPPRKFGNLNSNSAMPVVADYSSQQIDETGLFYLRDSHGTFDPSDIHRPRILSQNYPLDLAMDLDAATTPFLFADTDQLNILINPYSWPESRFYVRDAGASYTATFGTAVQLLNTHGFVLDSQSRMSWSADPYSGVLFHVLFRYFSDGTQVTHLDEGEIALFQGCNYQGKATVFATNTPDFSKLSSTVITLDKSAASVKVGNNTSVTLFAGAGYSGASQVIKADTPCLDSLPIGRRTTAIQVSPLVDVLLSTKSCEHCQLQGVNLSKIDLSGLDLLGADLTGANLTGITANQTIFEQAILDRALGLAGGNLTGARLAGAKLRGADLSKTALPSVIDGADFTGATLTGVKLENIRMKRTVLDKVIGFAGADLSQVAFTNASLRQVNLSGAKLYGASFSSADLEGSNLSGAFLTKDPAHDNSKAAALQGAHLKNVNLSRAQLSGANFTNSSFYGTVPAALSTCQIAENGFTKNCATAAGATLNGAQFSGAYLYGADFTNTTIVGVEFGNSVLTGANFAGASLSTGPLGAETGFASAFLQGANLATATLSGTSLQGAFVDFRPQGNDLYMQLDDTHTTFPNAITSGQVCVFAYYSNPTTVPIKNTTITCPDGSPAGADGCGATAADNSRWASLSSISQGNPPASYLQDATYTKKARPACGPPLNW
jgi:uncharacterized protein YjbI with pentapeptide repeats